MDYTPDLAPICDFFRNLLDHLRAHGVEITFEEDRQGGVLTGPRAYFHDPDGTVLGFIDLTSYAGTT
jgi:catechol 2,3-dioxygenase-like lactoylglutathione lyase family enzyme